MLPLDDSEVTNISSDLLFLMPNVCDISRPTRTSDGRGGHTNSYTSVYTDVPCSFYPASAVSSLAQDIDQNNVNKAIGQWIILLPAEIILTISDRILVTDAGGLQFEVVTSDHNASFGAGLTAKATLVE